MRRTPNRHPARSAFTLVELLVVMTIIAILVALTAAAVVKAIQKADETKTRNEISQLAGSITAFKGEFQAQYVADQIVLPPGLDNTGESARYITSLWPRIDQRTLGNTNTPFAMTNRDGTVTNFTIFTYWGLPPNSNQPITLQGHQAIVYFLGGMLVRDSSGNVIAGPLGFSTSPIHPMDATGPTGATNRKGPYYDFPTNRLMMVGGAWFPSFQDVYGVQPYIYFTSHRSGNDYTLPATGPKPFVTFVEYPDSSKSKVVMYRFANPSGFQILAAGRDTAFGLGFDNWPGATVKLDSPPSTSPGGTNLDGYDDMSNFHPTLLGIPAQ